MAGVSVDVEAEALISVQDARARGRRLQRRQKRASQLAVKTYLASALALCGRLILFVCGRLRWLTVPIQTVHIRVFQAAPMVVKAMTMTALLALVLCLIFTESQKIQVLRNSCGCLRMAPRFTPLHVAYFHFWHTSNLSFLLDRFLVLHSGRI